MDRYEALYSFWSSFGVPAFEENSVPTSGDYPKYPYITYEVSTGGFNSDINVNGYIWTRSNSWISADKISDGKQQLHSQENPARVHVPPHKPH